MTMTTEAKKSSLDSFWENVRTIVYALALAMLLRFTVVQPFRIPSGSMQPTLEMGDYIVVTKWSYGYSKFSFTPLEGLLPNGRLFASEPKRGDIVVFRPAKDGETRDFVKRLIGMPGDRIRVTNSVLYINDTPVPREHLGSRVVERQRYENGPWVPVEVQEYRETLPNGVSYITYDELADGELDNTRTFVVEPGTYFMMGDDRDNSRDSRTREVDLVPTDHLIGPAQFVFASFDRSTSIFQPWTLFTGFRGDRFMKSLN